jgi:predicted phage-related endonuclease
MILLMQWKGLKMQTVNVAQGTPEWHSHRAISKNASDSPVVMSKSQYKTRTQLMQERKTGIVPAVDPATQRRFDDGHRFEALARPIAEGIIGEDLYPITGVNNGFSASFDGLTLDEIINWEHKTLNDDLRAVKVAADLHIQYRIQMEHQMMVSDAEKTLFMASKFDDDGVLLEKVLVWYYPDLELRAQIVAAWEQFEKDEAEYVPKEATPVVVAAPVRDLPAIIYNLNGMSLTTNLHEDVKPFVLDLVEKSKKKLETDQDFADLDALCKMFKKAEEQCAFVADQAIGEIKDVAAFGRDLKELQEIMAAARIAGTKRVSSEKETRKAMIIAGANSLCAEYAKPLEEEINPLRLSLQLPNFATAIKGMAKLDNINYKCNDVVAAWKCAADAEAKDIRAKLVWYKETSSGYGFLFHDLSQIITKPMDDFQLVVISRISKHKEDEAAKLEEQRKAIQAEEEAKAAKIIADEVEALRLAELARLANIDAVERELNATINQPVVVDAQSGIVEPVINHIDTKATVIDNQDAISTFMATREFGNEKNKIRAILVEFVKYQASYNLQRAA